MNDYRPPSFSLFPPVVKNLLIANVLFFIATFVVHNAYQYDLAKGFGLHYFFSTEFKIYQLVTYLFLHDTSTVWHLVSNMFALWMFGNVLENFWGGKRFLLFYLVCGIGAGLTQELTQYFYLHGIQNAINIYSAAPNMNDFALLVQKYFSAYSFPQPQNTQESIIILQKLYEVNANIPTIGASGAIFGVLLAFGVLFPNTLLYLYFAIPIKAKYFVVLYGLLELFLGFKNSTGDNVAHFAHLGGMVFGFILIMYWKQKRTL